jgi:Na+/melibiose symporter-like transporter
MVDTGLIIAYQILTYSMAADIVEQAELQTGRRTEGVIFAAIGFIEKMIAGVGIGLGTLVLTAAGLEAGATATEVSPDTLWRLGAIYVPTILFLWMSMIAVMSLYKIDRKTHEANLRALSA